MKSKNLYAILMAGITLMTIFSAISVNAVNDTQNDVDNSETTFLARNIYVWCTIMIYDTIPYRIGLPGVQVTVYDSHKDLLASGITDQYGRVNLDVSHSTSTYFKLYFSHNEYKAKPHVCDINPDSSRFVEIKMTKKLDTGISESENPVVETNPQNQLENNQPTSTPSSQQTTVFQQIKQLIQNIIINIKLRYQTTNI